MNLTASWFRPLSLPGPAQGLRCFVAALTLAPLGVPAHELWLDRQGEVYVLHQGHRSAAHAGPELVPYPPDFVRGGLCFDEGGTSRPLTGQSPHPVRFAGRCAALLVWASSGHWTKTPWETRNAPKTGIPGVLKSWRSEDSVKRLDAWSPALARPLGSGLEITAQEDPFKLVPGDKLRLLVTYQGQARARVPVAYDGATRGATDETGMVVLRLRHDGLQFLSASIELPLADGQADSVIVATMFNFDLPRR